MGRPPYVYTDDGKVVITRESHPSWRGLHNSTKSKILLQLYAAWSRGNIEGLCLSELVTLTGTSPLSLQTLLPRWVRWEYTKVGAKLYHDRAVKCYKIAPRGRRFVELRIPPSKREEFIAQIRLSRIRKNS